MAAEPCAVSAGRCARRVQPLGAARLDHRLLAGETNWCTLNTDAWCPGKAVPAQLNTGHEDGAHWLPAEVDVSIRPGWFYHAAEDERVRSVENLVDIYYHSVGRGANLILNLPPDRRGRIHDNDVASLRAWRKTLDATFAKDLAAGATATADNTRGGDAQFAPANVLDAKGDTYWSTDDNATTPSLTLDLGKPVAFDVMRVREYLPLGQRIDSIAVDTWNDGKWTEWATATSIGSQRLLKAKPVTASKVRLRVTQAAACPAISEVGLFLTPQK